MLKNRRILGFSALMAVLALLLSACGGGGSASGGGGDSVAVGATKEQYIEALADMEPVTLSMQLPTTQGSASAAPQEEWAQAVEEWSGGKIKFDILYSGSRVPVYQMANGISDGLVDSGYVLLYTEPERFPNNALLTDLMMLNKTDPVAGQLQMGATWIDFTYTESSIREEAAAAGMELLVPSSPQGNTTFICKDAPASALADFRGKQIRASSPANVPIIEALGATASDIPTQELYQALQRGTVDCAVTVPSLTISMSLNEVAKGWTADPTVMMSASNGGMALSLDKWEALPLAAQQLMYDKLDVYYESYFKTALLGQFGTAVEEANKRGMQFAPLAEDAKATITAAQEEQINGLPARVKGADGTAFVNNARATSDKWGAAVAELGYSSDVTWGEVDKYLAANDVDVKPLVEKLTTDVLSKHRPGN